MKIALLTFSYKKTGGAEQMARNIYNSLKKDNQIKIISLDEIIICRVYDRFFLGKRIKKEIKNYQPNLIISLHPFLLKYFHLKCDKYKVFCWVHGIDVFGTNGLKVKSKLTQCDRIVAVSSFTKDHMIYKLDYPDKIDIINNCVDLNSFRYSKIPLLQCNTFNILTTGRLSYAEKYKGHDLVIQSLKKVNNLTNLRVIYTIVGDGNDRQRLEKLSENVGVDNQVVFKGKISFNNLIKEYKKSDLFVMPSFFKKKKDGTYTGEGFGIVYIEAGAVGRPVIGCDVGGQTDCIIDNFNGKLVQPDIDDIAKKIVFFAENYILCVEMGRNNRKLVEERFAFDIFKKNINKLILSVYK